MNNEKLEESRIYWLDVARTFAVISITLNHAINRTFDMEVDTMLEYASIPVYLSVFKAFIQVLSRIGVPIFLMITGTLLLKKDYSKKETAEKFYKHNWFSLFITAECWFFIMYLYKSFLPESIFRTKGIAAGIVQLICNQIFINQDTFASMWYMTMILCVYLVIPFIALGIKKIQTKYILIPFAIAITSAFLIPNINSFYGLIIYKSGDYLQFNLSIADLFSMYVIYIVIGYMISSGLLEKYSNRVVLFGAIVLFTFTSLYQLWAFTRPGN